MCTEVNSAMGLQATTATKRKHDLTFESKDTNTYTNCPPPIKASKWSLKNNNYIDSVEEQKSSAANGLKLGNKNISSIANYNNNENKSCEISCSTITYNLRSGKEVTRTKLTSTKPVLNAIVANIPASAEGDGTTPLPPTSSSPVPEDSIARLEVVANVPWTSAPEPVDCISKLQAVAVPCDPWGSITTRSTLATTLLSADEIDDDDDDFEDDYEEEESIIPTYCPLRYHAFPPPNSSSPSNLQNQRITGSFANSSSYISRPNYYSEPFPQQNCSRTGGPQHLRVGNGFSWTNGNNNNFYTSSESSYSSLPQQPTVTQQIQPQTQQQTIRCAENGKSYLELGCSSPVTSNISNSPTPKASPASFTGMHASAPAALEPRIPLKRCCDGRGAWCGANKSCYKDIRLKIRNLSMFKLSRFRQVSEQSLYRSVLICNTLKRIDREIEAETKELHQAAAHVAQQHHSHINHSAPHHQPQYHNLHSHMQTQSPLSVHSNNNNTSNVHHHQLPQQQLQSHQPMLHHQHQDYMPIPNCGRLGVSVDYQNQHQQQTAAASLTGFHQQHHYHNERMESSPFHNSLQKSTPSSQFTNNQSMNSCTGSVTTTTLHPYDHYPFRETHSGRATPFPSQTVISLPPASASSLSPASSPLHTLLTSPASSTTAVSANNSVASESDSGYTDDDSTRSINWSSVLSLSSQSALDPITNNDLFSILPPANPATAVPVPISSSPSASNSIETNSPSSIAVATSGTFTTVQSTSMPSLPTTSFTSTIPPSATTSATFTTLSTISSATHSLTSSYVSSMSSNSNSASSTWEYGFLDMEFGLGTEFTELSPSCKLSVDDFGFKNGLTPVTVTRYDNELEQPAHIMVGS